MNLKSLVLILLLGASIKGHTQGSQKGLQTNQVGFYSFHLGAGTANYFGDLVNPGDFGQPGLNITGGVEYQWKPRFTFRSSISYLHLSGDDRFADDDRQERNLSFFSNNWEWDITVAYGVVKVPENGYANRKYVNVYTFVGAGMLWMNPKATRQDGTTVKLAPLETEGYKYSRLQFVLPFGLGAKIKIDPRFNIRLEGGYRVSFSDYLDDVSVRNYPDPTTLKSDLSREMSDRRREIDPDYPIRPGLGKRGNNSRHDGFLLLNLALQYTLGGKEPKTVK